MPQVPTEEYDFPSTSYTIVTILEFLNGALYCPEVLAYVSAFNPKKIFVIGPKDRELMSANSGDATIYITDDHRVHGIILSLQLPIPTGYKHAQELDDAMGNTFFETFGW